MFIYTDRITVQAHYTADQVEGMLEKIRGVGSAERELTIRFTLEAPDLWELRGKVEELAYDLDASYEASFDAERENVREVK